MAKMYHTIFMRRVGAGIKSGRSSRTIPTDKLWFDDPRVFNVPPKTPQAAWLEATTYANFAEGAPVYLEKAQESGTTSYQQAVADWFDAPRVLEINVDRWTGERGQTIRVKARDHFGVVQVAVVIRDQEQRILEAGEAVQTEAGSSWWSYTTRSRVEMTPFPIVEAIARDLPGNTDTFAIS